MTDLPVLVAGGGIAGLAASLALAARDIPVRLFEQARAFEEVGAGIQMPPNGVAALRALGAWEAVEPACVIPSEIHVRDGTSGALLQRVRLGKSFEQRFGAPYRVCHRADLLGGLVSAASASPRIELGLASRVTGFRQDADSVTLTLGTGLEARGRAAVAADGIRSLLREEVCPGVALRPGHMIYRSLMPLGTVPPAIATDCVTLWLCAGGHVVHYPVSNWRNFNMVAAVDNDPPAAGWSEPAPKAEVARHFASACDELAELLEAPHAWLRWQGADLPDLPRWSKHRLVLVGDAAHATLPYLAQGAVMALEDAVVLAANAARENYLPQAFDAYHRARRQRTARVQTQSRRMGAAYHAAGPVAWARNAFLRWSGGNALLRRTAWLYAWRPGQPDAQ